MRRYLLCSIAIYITILALHEKKLKGKTKHCTKVEGSKHCTDIALVSDVKENEYIKNLYLKTLKLSLDLKNFETIAF